PAWCLGPAGLLRGLGDTDDADGDARAGVAGGLAAIIRVRVDHQTPAEDRVHPAGEGDVIDRLLEAGLALVVGFEIAEVTRVALVLFVRQAVVVTFGVVVAAGAAAV